jgi:imidazolonepropionase-like amidohydrolase
MTRRPAALSPAFVARPCLPLWVLCLLTLPHSTFAQPTAAPAEFALRARAIYPCTADTPGPIEDAVLIVRDGKIAALGRDLPLPPDLPVFELRDATIMPGLVSAAAALSGNHGGNETVAGDYRALDAFDNYADYTLWLARGVTTAHLDPGEHRLVTGVGAVVKLAGPPAERVLRPAADLAINLNPIDPPRLIDIPFFASSDEGIRPAVRQRPESRLGRFLELDQRIAAAKAPGDARFVDEFGHFDAQRAAFAAAWNSELPLRISADRAADLSGALTFIARHRKPAYIVGGAESHRIIEDLRAARLPLVYRVMTRYADISHDPPSGRLSDLGPDPDALDDSLRAIGRLAAGDRDAAVPIALAGRLDDAREDLRLFAALAVRGGLPRERALAAITRIPAEILGVQERVGSLAVGRDADFIVLTGRPLDAHADVLQTYVGGRRVFEAPQSAALVVRAGTIWVGNGAIVNDGAVLIEDGKISAVGQRVPQPPFAHVIDAGREAFVTPGFIDAHGHLGLERDGAAPAPDVPIHSAIGVAGREFLRVARNGVTTILLAAYNSAANGSQVAAVKTFGRHRGDMLVRDTAGVHFTFTGKDPLEATEAVRRTLEAGRKYEEAWKKYEADLKKWEEDRRKGIAEKPKDETETKVETDKPDPITGTWEFTLSGGPLPESVTGTAKLRLSGTSIDGRLTAPGADEEVVVTGTLEGNSVTLEIDQETPIGKPTIRATLDRDDHMAGKLALGDFSIDFEATRTDKAPVEFKVVRSRKKRGGRPLPPKVEPALEPLRPLLAGKIPAVLDAQTAPQIQQALKLFIDDFKVPLVLVGADDAADVGKALVERKDRVGVVVPPAALRRRDRTPYNQAADLARLGVPVALQSNAEDGARNLPLLGLFAVQQGLGGDAALRALTIDAAKMYRIDDRIGSLEVGKDGDLLIHSGHPFDADSRLERVIVGGREVPNEE